MRHRTIVASVILMTFLGLLPSATSARELAGIPWREFKQRSEFVFEGILTKAEMLASEGRASPVRYTYKVYKVFKGKDATEISFIAPLEEDVNKSIGTTAIVALRMEKDAWVLSVDQRSCWTHESRTGKDFGSVPVFKIPAVLLYGLPAELSEEVEIKVPYGSDYHDEKTKVYPMARVEKQLKALLAAE